MKYVLLVFLLFVYGCGGESGHGYKQKFLHGKLESYNKGEYEMPPNRSSFSKYTFWLGPLVPIIPLNFWDVRLFASQDVDRFIKHYKKHDDTVIGAKNIYVKETVVMVLPLIWVRTEVDGTLIYNKDAK